MMKMNRSVASQLARRWPWLTSRLDRRSGQLGQMIVLFALCLLLMIAMAGLLIDGGNAWVNQRQAQAAADTAALAGAVALSDLPDLGSASVKAQAIALANGFGAGNKKCDNSSFDNIVGLDFVTKDGVTVNWPPKGSTASHNGDPGFVEVVTTRAMRTAFAGAVGQPCWLVTARAVASLRTPGATCSFCALTKWKGDGDDNVLSIDNTGHMRADGDIVVNGPAIDGAACVPNAEFNVCGTAIHLYHTGGTPGAITHLSAPHISISGGWTSNAGTTARADNLAVPCVAHPDPNGYAMHGYPTSQVCIGSTPLPDPLNDPENPIQPPNAFTTPIPHQGVNGCPTGTNVKVPTGTPGFPVKLVLTKSTAGGIPAHNFIICPGLYPGGFSVTGDFTTVHVEMKPGVYFMLGGGFQVDGTASIDGSAGVMIYNSGGSQAYSLPTLPWTGTLPPCTVGACKPTTASLGGPAGSNIETPVTYTLTLTAPTAPNPSGTVTFYDGDAVQCVVTPLTVVGTRQAKATCAVTFHEFGTHWITGVYSGDSNNAWVKDDMSTVVNPNPILGIQVVDICTGAACGASAPCVLGGACTVLLHSPFEGASYHGMLIFQDRTQSIGIRLWPALGLADCVDAGGHLPGDPPSWMTAHVPGGPNPGDPLPDPCGALGGLSGTVYSPHSRTGIGWDANVDFRADGVTNLQIIAGRISLSYNTDARFLFNADEFAGGGKIRLRE